MPSKMTTIRFSDEDLSLIEKLRRATGIPTMSAIIREALKEYHETHKAKKKSRG